MDYVEEILLKVGTPDVNLVENIRWAMLAGVPLIMIEDWLDQAEEQI